MAASTGAACHEGAVELSPVLRAMAIPPHVGMGAIRFSLGIDTTSKEIEWVVDRLREVMGYANAGCVKTEAEDKFVFDYCI